MAKYEVEMRDAQCRHTISLEASSIEDAKDQAAAETAEWIEGGEWGDEGATVEARWTLKDGGDEVADGWVCVEIPADEDALIPFTVCGDSVDEHEWTSEGCGGLEENPGVWSTGGTSMVFRTRCSRCGLVRTDKTTGSQRNPGEHDTVVFEMPLRD